MEQRNNCNNYYFLIVMNIVKNPQHPEKQKTTKVNTPHCSDYK